MDDDYKCYKCRYFRRDTQTCKSKIGCIEESNPDDFEVNKTDIFERSPESNKTRREHFSDLSNRDLAIYIRMYVQNRCKFCIYDETCIRSDIEFCTNGITQWLERRVGIYD